MKNKILFFSGALVFFLFLAPLAHSASIDITPAFQTIGAGDPVTVTINANDVKNLCGFQLRLTYDRRILTAPIAYEGGFLAGAFATFRDAGSIEDTSASGGTKLLGMTFMGEADGKNGAGPLLKVVFKAKASGTSRTTLTDVQFIDSSSAAIVPARKMPRSWWKGPPMSRRPAMTRMKGLTRSPSLRGGHFALLSVNSGRRSNLRFQDVYF